MTKVANGFPAHETHIGSDPGYCAGSQGSQTEFPASSKQFFFCNVAPLHLALALNTDRPGSLPGQSGPPEIKG